VAELRRLLQQAQSLRGREVQLTRPGLTRALCGAGVAAAAAAWYWLFVLPPRLLGSADPDRFYHLALSRLIANSGLPRTLPQVEDLGWGQYFPDKEFLFHALTALAWKIGEAPAVLWLVPLLGTAILLCIYAEVSRINRPLPAMLMVVVGALGTAGLMFRLSLLRPHLLAVLVFVLLLMAILRERPRLAALAAAAFALAYHAFIVVGFVIGACWLLRRQPGFTKHTWAWCLGGLALGTLVHPYFPSNLVMGVLHLRLALGLESVPPATPGTELYPPTLLQFFQAYGFYALLLVGVAIAAWRQRPQASAERSGLVLMFILTGIFCVLGTRTLRAMEYGVPCGLLLFGYALRVFPVRHALPALLAVLLLCQGQVDWLFYRKSWNGPDQSSEPAYAAVLAQVPQGSKAKVFNCEWEAGPFVFYARPDLRFVDLLEPTFLYQRSREHYAARRGLVAGEFADPRAILRGAFHADYVLCQRGPLTKQMQERPQDFSTTPGSEEDTLRLFAVRPD
jgi:hypothetical protein